MCPIKILSVLSILFLTIPYGEPTEYPTTAPTVTPCVCQWCSGNSRNTLPCFCEYCNGNSNGHMIEEDDHGWLEFIVAIVIYFILFAHITLY